MKFRFTGLALLFAGLTLAACGETRDASTGDKRESIALFTKNQTNPYFQTVRVAAQAAANELNVDLVNYIPTSNDSIPEQMSQIEDSITKRPSAAVFIPVDSKAMIPGVEKFNAANIPVVNLIDRADGGNFVSFMGCDDFAVAAETARYLFQKMNGKGNVIIIEGQGGLPTIRNERPVSRKLSRSFPT